MNLTPQQRLDEVLKIMYPSKNEVAITYNRKEIHDELWKVPNITNEDVSAIWNQLSEIINKLEKDKYIYHEEVFRDGQKCYMITFEGELFKDSGGYDAEEKRKIAKADFDRKTVERGEGYASGLLTWTQNLANRTADLTFWTRLVAIGALGLVVWEIVAFAIEHHWFYRH